MPANLPYYHRYPRDYAVSNAAYCSLEAQGLYVRLVDLMHESERYGHLTHAGKAMELSVVARRLSQPLEAVERALNELLAQQCLAKEPGSWIIYAPELLEQDRKRAGARNRKHQHDLRQRTANGREMDGGMVGEWSGNDPGYAPTPKKPKSQKTLERGNADVTRDTRYDSDSDSPPVFTESSGSPLRDPEPPLPHHAQRVTSLPPVRTPEELAAEQAARLAGDLPQDGGSRSVGETIVDIALASPAGLALRWTEIRIEGNHRVLEPIHFAVTLEAKERGVTLGEAATWLLGRVREIAGLVQRADGWRRYWSMARHERFFRAGEYQNPEQFDRSEVGSNGNGSSSGNGRAPAGSSGRAAERDERNRAAASEALAELDALGSTHGGGARRGGALRERPEQTRPAAVHRSPAGPQPARSVDGAGASGGKPVVLPFAGGGSRAVWPD